MGLPSPSPLTLPKTALPKAPPPFVIKMAMALRSMLQRAADLVVPAEIAAFDRSWGAAITVMVGAVAKHRIVEAIGDDALTAQEIAKKTGTNADVVHRTLRALATQGMFAVDESGRFTNTRLSRGLTGGRPSRVPEFLTYFTSSSNLAAWADFDRVPSGCDAYSLKNVLHDWDDERCLKILGVVRKAMEPGARLLLMDVITEPNVGQGFGPLLDVHMLVACSGGRERGVEEFRRLLEKSGFSLHHVHAGPTVSVLDARAI